MLKNIKLKIITLLLIIPSLSFADFNDDKKYLRETIDSSPVANGLTCWDYAAKKYNVDSWMLFAIGAIESTFTPNIKSKNKNGTYDLGIMQINTIHIDTFKKMGISQHELQNDSCKGIIAAAFILRKSIDKFGNNVDGIGGYHSYTKHLRQAYGKKVIKKYNELVTHYYIKDNHFTFAKYKGQKYNKKNVYQAYQNNNNYMKASNKINKKADINISKVKTLLIITDENKNKLNIDDNNLSLKKSINQ